MIPGSCRDPAVERGIDGRNYRINRNGGTGAVVAGGVDEASDGIGGALRVWGNEGVEEGL